MRRDRLSVAFQVDHGQQHGQESGQRSGRSHPRTNRISSQGGDLTGKPVALASHRAGERGPRRSWRPKASKATDSRQLAPREQGGEAYVTPPNPDSPPPVPPLPGKVSGGVLGNVAFDLHSKLCDFVLAVTFGLIATALGILIKWDWHTSLGSDAFEILVRHLCVAGRRAGSFSFCSSPKRRM